VDAFEILADQYRPMLLTYLRSLTGNAEVAEDLVQETFVTAYEKMPTFHKGADFGAWVRGIARNKVLHDRRSRARRRVVADSRIVEGMEEVYATFDAPRLATASWAERLRVVLRCIEGLSGKLARAVEYVYRRNIPPKQAAVALDVSYDVVTKQLSRARTLLRECAKSRLAEGGAR